MILYKVVITKKINFLFYFDERHYVDQLNNLSSTTFMIIHLNFENIFQIYWVQIYVL